MKKIYYIIILCLLVSFSYAGNGTIDSPFSVKEMKTKKISSNEKYYVKGYVVGEFEAYSNNKLFYNMSPLCYDFNTAPGFGGYVYIIADSPLEYDINNCLTIQFPTTALMDDYGLDMHPEYWRKEFLFCGTHETYNNVDGIKKISDFRILSSDLTDESVLWNYFDDFEKGTTTAPKSGSYEYTDIVLNDSQDKWKGGYISHIYNSGAPYYEELNVTKYKLTNAAVDEGKPKWDDLAVCLRFENASIELISDNQSGIGEIEFWAGNYQDYSAYKMSFTLQYSIDGNTWVDIAKDVAVPPTNKSVTNGMTLFRYTVNKAGKCFFRIIKTDSNFGKGLQIDNLKFSQYQATTATPVIQNDKYIILTQNNGIEVKNAFNTNISVYLITGQRVCEINEDNQNTFFIPLNHGMYIVKINDSVKKIVL